MHGARSGGERGRGAVWVAAFLEGSSFWRRNERERGRGALKVKLGSHDTRQDLKHDEAAAVAE
eukprot:620448-Pleurochrysis_carterae.AAC.1